MVRNLVLGVLVAAALTAPAAAQDGSEAAASRTPENAQTFLTKVAEQYPIALRPESFSYSSLTDWYLGYKPVRIGAQDRCVTRFEGDVDQFRARDNSGELVNPGLDHEQSVQLLATRSDLVAKHKIHLSPYVINWSKVTYLGKMQAEPYNEATKSWRLLDNTVTIVMGEVGIPLSLPDNVLSDRMLLAMQTLKQACDATEGLGF